MTFYFHLVRSFCCLKKERTKKKKRIYITAGKKAKCKMSPSLFMLRDFQEKEKKKTHINWKEKFTTEELCVKILTGYITYIFRYMDLFSYKKKQKKIIFSPPRKISIWRWRISEYNFYTNHHNWKWLAINMEYFIELRKESIYIWHQRKNFFLKWKFRFCFKSSKFSDLWTR